MTNTKAWLAVTAAGALAYLAPDAIEYVANLLGSSTRLTPNSESELAMLGHIGQWVMAGGAMGAAGSIVGKLGGSSAARRLGLEGIADGAMLAYVARSDIVKDMLYKIKAYSPGTQSKMQLAGILLCALAAAAFFYGCSGKSPEAKEEEKK